ncbi:MAG: peptidoglycan DD-metalloendopeptidase family protein [Bacteriovoracaceae bacterium]|nr:peptidoglycan DD-metalloendopeptidase family protein [Bacteriovoracaceae bacterium]
MKSILALLILLPSLNAAVTVPKGKSLKQIKEELGKKARIATTIAASIKSLEKEIGKANNKYLERSAANKSLEEKATMLKEGLEQSLVELKHEEEMAHKLARTFALESQDDEDENALLKRTILKEIARKKSAEYKAVRERTNELKEAFASYEARLSQARNDEESLYTLIVDLENKKKDLSKKYISSVENKNELEETLENALAKRKAYKVVRKKPTTSPGLALIAPIDSFVDYKGGKKGVTFKYDTRTPIKASASGKVVYSGELASYGKVIMIDHGEEIRSVILGDVQIKVRKGDAVQRGQVVGYTLAEPGLKKSLYYEVRKKNVAQNTLEWLENVGTLAKANI